MDVEKVEEGRKGAAGRVYCMCGAYGRPDQFGWGSSFMAIGQNHMLRAEKDSYRPIWMGFMGIGQNHMLRAARAEKGLLLYAVNKDK